mmetsp:Transcript_28459/g.91895  ORF Transcript_28459/g.91895 Transcript_28459/m.91895 type:complete len:245 (+) Transcript_28459:3436-4170(+)
MRPRRAAPASSSSSRRAAPRPAHASRRKAPPLAAVAPRATLGTAFGASRASGGVSQASPVSLANLPSWLSDPRRAPSVGVAASARSGWWCRVTTRLSQPSLPCASRMRPPLPAPAARPSLTSGASRAPRPSPALRSRWPVPRSAMTCRPNIPSTARSAPAPPQRQADSPSSPRPPTSPRRGSRRRAKTGARVSRWPRGMSMTRPSSGIPERSLEPETLSFLFLLPSPWQHISYTTTWGFEDHVG